MSSGHGDLSTLMWLYLVQKATGNVPPGMSFIKLPLLSFVLYTHIYIVSDWLLLQFPDLPVTARDLLKSSSSFLSKCDFEVSNITVNPIVLKVPLFWLLRQINLPH